MDIRKATKDDLELVIKMAYSFLLSTNYKDYVDNEKFGQFVASFLIDTNKVIFLYEDIGMLAGFINPFIFGTKLMATEMAWWVEPKYRNKKVGIALINAFSEWAKENGCVAMSLVSLDDNISKMYEREGFKLYERAYFKEI